MPLSQKIPEDHSAQSIQPHQQKLHIPSKNPSLAPQYQVRHNKQGYVSIHALYAGRFGWIENQYALCTKRLLGPNKPALARKVLFFVHRGRFDTRLRLPLTFAGVAFALSCSTQQFSKVNSTFSLCLLGK